VPFTTEKSMLKHMSGSSPTKIAPKAVRDCTGKSRMQEYTPFQHVTVVSVEYNGFIY